jgi:hypothetical protein
MNKVERERLRAKWLNRPRTSKEDWERLKPVYHRALRLMETLEGEFLLRAWQLPKPLRAVFTTVNLDSEVRNGGFHQFFWNSEGMINEITEADLQFVGATAFLEIFKRATTCFIEFDVIGVKRRSKNTWEEFTAGYDTIPWKTFDTQYDDTAPTLLTHVCRYVEAHAQDYE